MSQFKAGPLPSESPKTTEGHKALEAVTKVHRLTNIFSQKVVKKSSLPMGAPWISNSVPTDGEWNSENVLDHV